MKTYHYKLGHVAGATMTVKELREKLALYPDEMPVFGTWEGVAAYIIPEAFVVQDAICKGDSAEAVPTLVIDVSDYY